LAFLFIPIVLAPVFAILWLLRRALLRNDDMSDSTPRFGRIRHDVVVGGLEAFQMGEVVDITAIEPDPDKPRFKYVVFSKALEKTFKLSEDEIEV